MRAIRVLLVDDEAEFVQTLSERIRMRGLDTDIALNGEEALALLSRSMPDVMILDLKMPGMDGLEVLRWVKKKHLNIPVLVLTGHGSDQDLKETTRLGAFDYLQKPVDIETLIAHIQRACENRIETLS